MFSHEKPQGSSSWTLGDKIGTFLFAVVVMAAAAAIIYIFGFYPSPAMSAERLRPLVHYAIIERVQGGSSLLDFRDALHDGRVTQGLIGAVAIMLVWVALNSLRKRR